MKVLKILALYQITLCAQEVDKEKNSNDTGLRGFVLFVITNSNVIPLFDHVLKLKIQNLE